MRPHQTIQTMVNTILLFQKNVQKILEQKWTDIFFIFGEYSDGKHSCDRLCTITGDMALKYNEKYFNFSCSDWINLVSVKRGCIREIKQLKLCWIKNGKCKIVRTIVSFCKDGQMKSVSMWTPRTNLSQNSKLAKSLLQRLMRIYLADNISGKNYLVIRHL